MGYLLPSIPPPPTPAARPRPGRWALLPALLLALLALPLGAARAQTTLYPGDIAFTGYNADFSTVGTQGDEFSFIVLANLAAGTQITFSTSGYTDATASPANSLQYGGNYIVWQAPVGGTAPGTVVRISGLPSSAGYSATSGSVVSSVGPSGSTTTFLSIFVVGDQLVAFQGASSVPSTGSGGLSLNFIAAIHFFYSAGNRDATTGWNATCTFVQGQHSVKYPGLTNGLSCVVLADATTTSPDNGKYTGPLTGTACAVRAAINNRANWSFNDATIFAIAPTDYTVGTITAPPLAPTGAANQTKPIGSTVSSLTATGTAVQWYATPTGGTALPGTTPLAVGTTYYGTQTVNSCESNARLAVLVVALVAANQAPTISNQNFSVAENSATTTVVGTVAATDPDAGQTLTYAITAGNTGNVFAINPSTGQLTVNGALNFEGTNSYALTVRVTDNAATPANTSATVTVSVTNENEAPVITPAMGPFSVLENAPAGTLVNFITATDPDAGTTLTYTITGGNTGGAFALNGNRLEVANAAALDFETTFVFGLQVEVSDGSLTATRSFTVLVQNVNEAPVIGNQIRTVPEDVAFGANVGAPVTASDPDAGTTLTYDLIDTTAPGLFMLDGATGQLTVLGQLDFETTPSYVLTVRVTDNGSPTRSSTATVTVNVTNVNEAPQFGSSFNTFFLLENTAIGTDAGNPLTAFDPDAGATLTYSITGGNVAGAFAIDPTTGQLTVAGPLDFETTSSYFLTVEVSDGSLSNSVAVNVLVFDENEAPVIANQTRSVAENTAIGTPVGAALTSSDVDADQTLTYAITAGNAAGKFAINDSTGQLTVAGALDFETVSTYALTVEVTDDGGAPLSSSATVTVNITDVMENTSLTVNSPQTVPAGTYSDITVTGTGVATLGGAVVVTGPFVVQTGGRLNTNCQPLTGPGTFTLAAGTTLGICDAAGISLTGPTGAVQVTGARSFASDATYVYNGTAPQTTGTGLPATVRELETANATGVSLSQPTAVTNVLRLTSGTLSTADQPLRLLSTATRTAYAVHNGGQTSGNVTVQRYIGGPAAGGYRHLSSPVQSTTVADLNTTGFTALVNPAYNNLPYVAPPAVSFPTVFGYDETRGGVTPAFAGFSTGYFSPATLATPLTSGRGYSVFMPGAKTPDFVGALTTGNVPMILTVTGTNASPNTLKAGWGLLGNPYAQPIDWDLASVPAGMSSSISVFRTTGGNNGQYLLRANGVGALPNGEIPLGQAFFARATTNNTVFTFTNALRVEANPATVARPVADARPTVRLTLQATTPDAVADETVIYAETGATLGEDNRFDGLRPGRNTGNVPTLATVIAGQEAAINGLPLESLSAGNTVVELTAALPTAGTYTLTAADVANLPAGTTVSLLDRQLNVTQPLTAGTAYQLTATAAGEVLAGRFALVFNASRVLSAGGVVVTPRALQVYPNPASAQNGVQVTGAVVGTRLTLFDAVGRAVAQATADATGATSLPLRGLAAGVYTLRTPDGRTARLVVE